MSLDLHEEKLGKSTQRKYLNYNFSLQWASESLRLFYLDLQGLSLASLCLVVNSIDFITILIRVQTLSCEKKENPLSLYF